MPLGSVIGGHFAGALPREVGEREFALLYVQCSAEQKMTDR